jgi:hypothetical protein
MPETITLLEQATSTEATKFLARVANLEHDELYMFIHAVSELKYVDGADKINEIVSIAKNVKNIDAALDDFYVA